MFAAIKVGGFALGLATCIVIALYIRHELSYDTQVADADRVFRIYNEFKGDDGGSWTATPAPLAPIIKATYPEIDKIARLIPYQWYNAGNNLMRRDDQIENNYEEGFAYADPELLDILAVKMIYGQSDRALNAPNTIVISKAKADKYFPDENPVGRTIILNDDKNQTLTIGGVMENFPATSHLHFDFLITLKEKEFWPGEQTDWCCWNYNPYVKLRTGTNPKAFENKMQSIRTAYVDYLVKTQNKLVDEVRKNHFFRLQPVKDIYLRSEGISDNFQHGDIRYIWMFGGIACFILILACINFINLSTAKSANRAREVGLRKVVGSLRSYIVTQFLAESVLYSVISFACALILVYMGLPWFNNLAGRSLAVPWTSWWFFPLLTGAAFLIGILAGLYPSFYLSSFKPVAVLKGNIARGARSSTLRSAMVVFQFTTSIVLIIGTVIIYRQMDFILHTKLGFDKDRMIMIQGANTLDKQQQAFKDELLRISVVANATISQFFPVDGTKRNQNTFYHEGKKKEETGIGAQYWNVDEDYIKTMGMKLIEGRSFSKDIASDSSAMVINQAMAKAMGFEKPLGQRITSWRDWTIVGVVEDFHWQDMKQDIRPVCLVRGDWGNIVTVKANTNKMKDLLQNISRVWTRFMPHQPFRYTFMDESYARMYDDVNRMGNIFLSFAILAVVVACLGLFALSAFMIEQRTKEISIRLVLGASFNNILRMLTQNFVALVLLSFILAVPLAWYMMQLWLQDYKYKIEITWDVFAVSGIVAVLIALFTVGYQSVKAALANPANSLRTE
jgi:putative ABC transport system permease protein